MKRIDCTTVYAHTFGEIELEMGRTPRGAGMTIRILESGRHYELKEGDTLVFTKKNMRFSPFHKDAGFWLDKDGYEQDGQRIVRDLLAGLARCGFKFEVTLE